MRPVKELTKNIFRYKMNIKIEGILSISLKRFNEVEVFLSPVLMPFKEHGRCQ